MPPTSSGSPSKSNSCGRSGHPASFFKLQEWPFSVACLYALSSWFLSSCLGSKETQRSSLRHAQSSSPFEKWYNLQQNSPSTLGAPGPYHRVLLRGLCPRFTQADARPCQGYTSVLPSIQRGCPSSCLQNDRCHVFRILGCDREVFAERGKERSGEGMSSRIPMGSVSLQV